MNVIDTVKVRLGTRTRLRSRIRLGIRVSVGVGFGWVFWSGVLHITWVRVSVLVKNVTNTMVQKGFKVLIGLSLWQKTLQGKVYADTYKFGKAD